MSHCKARLEKVKAAIRVARIYGTTEDIERLMKKVPNDNRGGYGLRPISR